MQLFSSRSKQHQRSSKQQAAARAKKSKHGKCRALCCGASRLSVSSSSCSSDAPEPLLAPPPPGLSNLAHGMVQARLQAMIDGRRSASARRADGRACSCACACGGCRKSSSCGGARACVLLVAMDKKSYNPREDFRRSIMEVITAKRMAEPAELRGLLNCYVSVNAREHRAAILEAFHEVCTSLFSCRG